MKYSKLLVTRLFLLLLAGISLMFCERMQYFPDKPIGTHKTVFLAHHGGGSSYEANTLTAAFYGLNNLEGIECDIQMSANGSLWLGHLSKTQKCGAFEETNFANLSDETIIKIDSCLGKDIDYYQLDSVFKYMSEKTTGKVISLDVKPWTPSKLIDLNIISKMNKMGQSIINLTLKYSLLNRVMVESESGDFLYYIKTHSKGIETYLLTNGDFELGIARARNAEFTGISFKYKFDEDITAEHIKLLHRKGLKIQIWTLNDTTEINEAIALQPDYIQTDNVEYVKKNK